MLSALSIRDFVIVEQLELEFERGFTVLTGETGAGKSILIDALQFALGERAQADAVREGCSRAEVAAEFVPGAAAREWLERFALLGPAPTNDDANEDAATEPVLVRRTLEAGGRGRCFINGRPATLGQLRELGELLLDVHGQHEHQLLLRPAAQQQLLDAHGQLLGSARAVAQAYAAWRAAATARAHAETEHESAAQQAEQLQQMVDELAQLAPEPDEWERLGEEQKRLAHGTALLEGARSALDGIAEAEDAVQPRLSRIAARLTGLSSFDQRLAPVLAALASADIQIEEAQRALRHYLGDCEFDDSRLAQVDERIASLHAAGRKWRTPPAKLGELWKDSRARLERLAGSADLAGLRQAEEQAAAQFQQLAKSLSALRQEAARNMGEAVSKAMQDLAMAGGRFEVQLVASEAAAGGLEKAEFLVSGHAGATARPLARVASGGELSRIGLAIAVTAATANLVPTLIFDEVDAGIGGPVAATVGRLLRQLGQARQVFCVTHLPQVAACADQHLVVRKSSSSSGQALSSTEVLTAQARVQEIARMLGGAQITALTQRHAQEMLQSG